MSGEVIKKWMIAELNATNISGVDHIRSADINKLPSQSGVFVALSQGNEDDRQYSDAQEVRVYAVAENEQAAHDYMNAVNDAITTQSGIQKEWKVDPRTNNLRLFDVQKITSLSPASDGINNQLWTGTIVLNVRGRDTRRA